jgi:hypothetical protein
MKIGTKKLESLSEAHEDFRQNSLQNCASRIRDLTSVKKLPSHRHSGMNPMDELQET